MQVLLYIVVFYRERLYSDMLLHIGFVGLQFYGWDQWRRSVRDPLHKEVPLVVESLTRKGWSISVVASVLISIILGWMMWMWTDADYPFADAFIAGTSIVAQWLLAHRRLQNWYFWIVVDIVAIGLFSVKGLLPTALLYAAFLVMAVVGCVAWHQTRKGRE